MPSLIVIAQISRWTPGSWCTARCWEQTGQVLWVCLWRTHPCRVRTPLLPSSLSPSSPVATTLHWMFAHVLSLCFSFFAHRWISLYFFRLKIPILPILKPSWTPSLDYGDIQEMYYCIYYIYNWCTYWYTSLIPMYYWLRIWPAHCLLCGILLPIKRYSC